MARHWGVDLMRRQFAAGSINRREFLRTLTLLGVSFPAATAMAAAITAPAAAQPVSTGSSAPLATDPPKRGGVLRCQMRVMDVPDPARYDWQEMGNLARHVLEPLTRTGADNITRPWLAERWEASNDLTRWTFYLRRGVRWSDGRPFTATDVAYTVNRWMDPTLNSSNRARFAGLRGQSGADAGLEPNAVEIIDAHTIRFSLRSPFVAFPESLADYPALIVPNGFAGDFTTNPVGTGPFQLAALVVGDHARFVRRPDDQIWGQTPYLDEILYLDYGDDEASMLAALANNQVDLLFSLNPDQVGAARQLPGIALYDVMSAATGIARMRITEAPFDDIRVRRAVRASIDHQRLLDEAYSGLGLPGEDHHVCPIQPEYAERPPPQRDIEAARRLLAEAGYPDGLSLTITCRQSPLWERRVCEVMVPQLAEAGITLTINAVSTEAYADLWRRVPFGLTSWTHRPLGVQTLSLGYRSGTPWNETAYSDPRFDALLDAAEGLLDVSRRRAVVGELEGLLQDASIMVQPFWRARHTAAHANVRGYRHHPALEHHFEHVWLSP
jgi:peptide/nickel transport system substrate-binding protein